MTHPPVGLRVLRTLGFIAGALVAIWLIAVTTFGPSLAIPRAPYWRWVLMLLSAMVFAGLAELGFEAIWRDTTDIQDSRDTPLRFGMIVAGLVISIALVALLSALWHWLLMPSNLGCCLTSA